MGNVIKIFVFVMMGSALVLASHDREPRAVVVALVDEVEIEYGE